MRYTRNLRLNALRMTTRERAHAHIKARLSLPEWYGNNLDALADCLGVIGVPTRILIRHTVALRQLGDYGDKLISVFARAVEGNRNLHLTLRERF